MEVSEETARCPVDAPDSDNGGSDTDSWTILDESPLDEGPLLVGLAHPPTREPSSRLPSEQSDGGDAVAATAFEEGDSDIEAVVDVDVSSTFPSAGDSFMDSLTTVSSDGIPITENPEEADEQKWLWSPMEEDLEDTEVKLTAACEEEEAATVVDDGETSSAPYPTEELPEAILTIAKGNTYNHHRNQRLNLMLTGTLVLCGALTLGLGVGHFLGWSERLEAEEQALQHAKVIKQLEVANLASEELESLRRENEKLMLELENLKDDGRKQGIELQNRINGLLLETGDLQMEVARLRYGHGALAEVEVSKKSLQLAKSSLMETKKVLDKISVENDQLRMQVGKAEVPILPSLEAPTTPRGGEEGSAVTSPSEETLAAAVSAGVSSAAVDGDERLPSMTVGPFSAAGEEEVVGAAANWTGTIGGDRLLVPAGGRGVGDDSHHSSRFEPNQADLHDDEEDNEYHLGDVLALITANVTQSFGEFKSFWKGTVRGLPTALGDVTSKLESTLKSLTGNITQKVGPAGQEVMSAISELQSLMNGKVDKAKRYLNDYMEKGLPSRSKMGLWASKQMKKVSKGIEKLKKRWQQDDGGLFCDGRDGDESNEPGSQGQSWTESWAFARSKGREDMRHLGRESDWVFDRAQMRKSRRLLERSGWQDRRLKGPYCRTNDEGEEECGKFDLRHKKQSSRIGRGKKSYDARRSGKPHERDPIRGGLGQSEERWRQRHPVPKPEGRKALSWGQFYEDDDDDNDDEDEDDDDDDDEVDDEEEWPSKGLRDHVTSRHHFFRGGRNQGQRRVRDVGGIHLRRNYDGFQQSYYHNTRVKPALGHVVDKLVEGLNIFSL